MLPTSQQKKKFEEERARRILLALFPEKYSRTTLSDAPDIVTSTPSIGIEVTSSLVGTVQKELSDHAAGTITNPGAYLASFVDWEEAYDIKSIFLKKLGKLNSPHYHLFSENNLFVYAWGIDDNELQDGITAICKANHAPDQSAAARLFDDVYIVTGPQLLRIAAAGCQVTRYPLSDTLLTALSQEAFTAIFGMTREEYYRG
jgi:hypothetical protein